MVIFAESKQLTIEMDRINDHPLYRKHDLDSAMGTLWEFYKSRFVALFLISLAMSVITQFATLFIDLKSLQSIKDPLLIFEKLKSYMVPFLILMVVSLLFNTILHYYILHKPLDSSQNILRCLYKSLKYFIPYLILMVVYALFAAVAVAIGIVALVIGVFFAIPYMAMICFFILPVMMAEETGMGTTITRTLKLSHSNFWPNMGWSVVFLILFIVISLVLSGVVLLPFAGSFIKTFANPQDTSHIINLPTDPLFLFLSSAVNALTLPLYPIFSFIIYFNGRAREESPAFSPDPWNYDQKVKVEDLYAKPRNENKF